MALSRKERTVYICLQPSARLAMHHLHAGELGGGRRLGGCLVRAAPGGGGQHPDALRRHDGAEGVPPLLDAVEPPGPGVDLIDGWLLHDVVQHRRVALDPLALDEPQCHQHLHPPGVTRHRVLQMVV
eukprot:scaffold10715_cov114-Isochrysis_galbana.AAC.27